MKKSDYKEALKGLCPQLKHKGVGINTENLMQMLLEENTTIRRPYQPDVRVRECDDDLYLCPVEDTTTGSGTGQDGLARITAARRKQLAKWSLEHDRLCHGEPLLSAVVQDLMSNHGDALGISLRYPDRSDRLAIAGALIAAILDVRDVEAKQADADDAAVQAARNKNTRAKLIALHKQISDTGKFAAGPCWCGYAGPVNVKSAVLSDTSLFIKYECDNCGLKGERRWLM